MKRLTAPELPSWLNAMVPYDRYLVDLGAQQMHVMEMGEGFPVVMVHGNPTWGFLYRRVVEALSGEPLRLIMPDLIGLGFSSKPRRAKAHTLENHGKWMGRFIELLDVDRLAMVVQDWGGAIGIQGLLRNPSIEAGLVVLNTVVGPPKPGFKATAFHRLSQAPIVSDLVFRGLQFPQAHMGLAQGDKKSIRGMVAKAYRYPLRRRRDNLAPLALARMVPDSQSHPSIEPLERCQAYVDAFDGPAAIVWGNKDPILGSVRAWIERCFPQAQCEATEAGHFLQEEVPEPIAKAIVRVAREMRK